MTSITHAHARAPRLKEHAGSTRDDHPSGTWNREMREVFQAWVATWRDVIQAKQRSADLLSGMTVAAVALPLNLALAVASGLPPAAGLLAGAIGGGLAALFNGAPLQITGPAAALSTLVLALVVDFGAAGAAAAALVVGGVQIVLGLLTAGRFAKYVPESVLAGFTTGVGLKLLDSQIPELLGFDYKVVELAQMMHQPLWLHHVSWIAVVSGLGVAFLVVSTKQSPRFPAALVGIVVVTFLAVYLNWDVERVGALPSSIPSPALPDIDDERWLALAARTMPLALLAAIESLLSARGTDRLSQAKREHNPNLELIGQGIGNIGAGLFSGMPVTGVVVRSSVNVQSGGKTRLSGIVHSLGLLLAILAFSGQIAKVPLAALAGLLCVIGMRLIEVSTLIHLVKDHKIEALAFVVTMGGTVSGHLMLGLVGGLAIHALGLLFTRGERAHEMQTKSLRQKGIRAVLDASHSEARRPEGYEPAERGENWLTHIRESAAIPATTFIHGHASVIGRVVLGEEVHIAAGSSVRADEGTPFFIGASSNIQDGVVIHALKNRHVLVGGEPWAVYVGKNVSIAHDALVHGPCYIGDDTFVGFKAVVHDSIVGENCYIGIGAIVVGVEVPSGRFVPHGAIVDSADAVERLGPVQDAMRAFNEDVVEVNRGLAAAYHENGRDEHVGRTRKAFPASSVPRLAGLPSASQRPEAWEVSWGAAPNDPLRF